MVTVAMRNGFAWAQRWELETSGPFTLRRPDFRNGSRRDMSHRSTLVSIRVDSRPLQPSQIVRSRLSNSMLESGGTTPEDYPE
jgi:hypothetical protein